MDARLKELERRVDAVTALCHASLYAAAGARHARDARMYMQVSVGLDRGTRAHALRAAADCVGEATQLHGQAAAHVLVWLLS